MRSLSLIALAACGGSALPAGDDVPAPDAPVSTALGHPFGTHTPYAPGTQLPDHPQAELDAATTGFYATWKAAYLVAGCTPGDYRVKTMPATATEFTVSEGHGYGMLIAAIIAGHDPDARAIFDGLYHYYASHWSTAHPGLMAWAQDAACADIEGADSATDGDFDIAYALLLADRQWGSTGAIDYATAAHAIIAASLDAEVHPASSILVGDWADATDSHYTGTRPSDFMTGHFRAFAAHDPRWTQVADHTYATVAYLQAHAAAQTGLLPDFAIDASGATPAPAPGNWLEGADDGHYSYNACRVPWRLGLDAIVSGEARARTAVGKLETWLAGATAGKPTAIRDGYKLDGTVLGTAPELAFVAPALVGAMLDTSARTWLTALWDETAARAPNEYYGDTLKLLAMLAASDNWWAP